MAPKDPPPFPYPLSSDQFLPSPYHSPVRREYDPYRRGKEEGEGGGGGRGEPGGRGNAWASRGPAVGGKNSRTVQGSYLLSLPLLS